VDPLVLVVAAVCVVVYSLHGFDGTLTRDLGVYSYAGQQMADGVPPYLGILNRAGPLAHVIPGVGVLVARLSGFDDVVTMRVLFMLIATACVCVVYLLGRDLFRSRAAGMVGAATLLAFHGFIQYASDGPREKTPMTLFISCALWAVTRRRWFTAGVCVSLATLCLQTAFFSTFAVVVVGALALAGGGRMVALGRIALGGLVPVAVLGVWFALAGSLTASIDAFYVINRRYTVPDPATDKLDAVWLDLHTAFGMTVWRPQRSRWRSCSRCRCATRPWTCSGATSTPCSPSCRRVRRSPRSRRRSRSCSPGGPTPRASRCSVAGCRTTWRTPGPAGSLASSGIWWPSTRT
jgi:hypothetical protein